MRVYINNFLFTEEPYSCGSCPFFSCGATDFSSGSDRGHCCLWNEMHKRWINTPSRCKKLFRKAAKYDNGEKLVIVGNLKKNEE